MRFTLIRAKVWRTFMFAPGVIGDKCGAHAMTVLQAELRAALGQLGCASFRQ